MTNIFCTDCYYIATMHADGTVACGCSVIADPETETIPASWDTTREAIYALQLEESGCDEVTAISAVTPFEEAIDWESVSRQI
jgi:hypothetical protein